MYDNKQKGQRNVKVRLDRAVASNTWSDRFAAARVRHLMTSRSDHLPAVLLTLERDERERPPRKPWHYEIMWEREESLPEEIKVAWEQGLDMSMLADVSERLARVMESLRSWSKEMFGAVNNEIKELKRTL